LVLPEGTRLAEGAPLVGTLGQALFHVPLQLTFLLSYLHLLLLELDLVQLDHLALVVLEHSVVVEEEVIDGALAVERVLGQIDPR